MDSRELDMVVFRNKLELCTNKRRCKANKSLMCVIVDDVQSVFHCKSAVNLGMSNPFIGLGFYYIFGVNPISSRQCHHRSLESNQLVGDQRQGQGIETYFQKACLVGEVCQPVHIVRPVFLATPNKFYSQPSPQIRFRTLSNLHRS